MKRDALYDREVPEVDGVQHQVAEPVQGEDPLITTVPPIR